MANYHTYIACACCSVYHHQLVQLGLAFPPRHGKSWLPDSDSLHNGSTPWSTSQLQIKAWFCMYYHFGACLFAGLANRPLTKAADHAKDCVSRTHTLSALSRSPMGEYCHGCVSAMGSPGRSIMWACGIWCHTSMIFFNSVESALQQTWQNDADLKGRPTRGKHLQHIHVYTW